MRCHSDTRRPARARRRGGFTLIEAALTTVIVGVGVVAMLQLLAAGTIVNREGTEVTTALNLAKNVREYSLHLHFREPDPDAAAGTGYPYTWGREAGESASDPTTWDDVDDMAGSTFGPPINGAGVQMASGYAGWQQKVTVQTVDPNNVTSTVALPSGTLPAVRVTVDVLRNNRQVCQQSWYVFEGMP